jgi:hypothetical protein
MPPVKKIAVWLVVIFLGYTVLTAPSVAARIIDTARDFTYWRGVFCSWRKLNMIGVPIRS